MTSDDPNFMAAVELTSAKLAIEDVLDGFERGLVRVEHVFAATIALARVQSMLYRTKPSQTRFCACGCGREATIAAYEGCG